MSTTTSSENTLIDRGRTALRAIIDGNLGQWIGGRAVTGTGDEIGLISPSDGTVIGSLSAASEQQLNETVAVARTAFNEADWAKDAKLRARVLRRLADLVEADAEEIAYLDGIEAGKVAVGSVEEDVPDVAANLRLSADLISRDDGRFLQNPDGWGWVTKVPSGVVGAILPWNYPVAMLGWKIAPALAAGNAMVVKTSEDSTLSALHLAKLATEAGVPDGILNVLTGTGAGIGAAMGLHNDIDVLTFTGSGPVGRSFLESSARSNLKKVSLELGGRAGYIVDSEHATDFPTIAADIAGAAFGTSGQNCTAASRVIYVGDDDERFAEFRTALIDATEALIVGDPFAADTDVGPVINARAHERITAWIDEAVEKGARILNTRADVPSIPAPGTRRRSSKACPMTANSAVERSSVPSPSCCGATAVTTPSTSSTANPTGWPRACGARTSPKCGGGPAGSGWAPSPSTATAKAPKPPRSAECASPDSGVATTARKRWAPIRRP
jgi:gamma-glutamyl-gamma-aminobutyraldehyde dehydrogenase